MTKKAKLLSVETARGMRVEWIRGDWIRRRRAAEPGAGRAWNGFVVVTPPNPARDARVATDSC